MAAHTESFLQALLRIVSSRLFEVEEIAENAFAVTKAEPVDLHFEALGYETSSALINLSSIAFLLVVMVGLVTLIDLGGLLAPKDRQKTQLEKASRSNGAILFIDLVFLIVTFCCVMSIYMEDQRVLEGETNHQVAIALLCLMNASILSLYTYLLVSTKAKPLSSLQVKKRFGAAYANLSLENHSGRLSLGYQLFTFARRVALAFVLTFAKWSMVT